jgi:hypothetical protein
MRKVVGKLEKIRRWEIHKVRRRETRRRRKFC